VALQAGQLNRRIGLYRRLRAKNATTGEEEGDWQPFARDPYPWAKVETVGGAEAPGAEVATATTTKLFTVWYRRDVSVEDRVLFEGKAYDVQTVDEVGDREALQIRAVARAER
jgi:SPP1 family predicted phage head-tail adaptor